MTCETLIFKMCLMFLSFSCIIKSVVYTLPSFILNVWFNVFHLYQFFDMISFLMEKPCGKELLYNRCAPHSLIIFLSFNVVYFDPPIISINLRGYNTCKTAVFFCIVFAKSFNIITIIILFQFQ